MLTTHDAFINAFFFFFLWQWEKSMLTFRKLPCSSHRATVMTCHNDVHTGLLLVLPSMFHTLNDFILRMKFCLLAPLLLSWDQICSSCHSKWLVNTKKKRNFYTYEMFMFLLHSHYIHNERLIVTTQKLCRASPGPATCLLDQRDGGGGRGGDE